MRRPLLSTVLSRRAEQGLAAIEAALIAPVLLLGGLAIVDGACLMLTVHRIETGLNAGAAFLARAHDPAAIEALGRNLAVTGDPAGMKPASVRGWRAEDVSVTVEPRANTGGEDGDETVLRGGDTLHVVRLSTRYRYQGLGLLKLVGLGDLELSGFHEERAFGVRP